jgi:hypothetical protein
MTGEGGTFEITGIETTSTLGIMIVATDCDGEDATMYPSATGVSADSYSGLADGGVANSNAYQLMLPMVGAIDAGLTAAAHMDAAEDGDAATFTEQGGLIAFMLDGAGNPVQGATIGCAAGYCPTYYNTQAMMGGLSFMGNTGELAVATDYDGLAVLPGAPITNYVGGHDVLEFDSITLGSLPGIALFVALSSDDVVPE